MKTKLFNAILDVVSEVTEIGKEDILSFRKDEEILEARVLFVWFCNLNGMHAPDIAKFLGRKSQTSVNEKLHDYHSWSATSTIFRCYAKKIAAILPIRIEQVTECDMPST